MVAFSNDMKNVVRRFYVKSHCGYRDWLEVVWPVQAYLHARDLAKYRDEIPRLDIDRGDLDSREGREKYNTAVNWYDDEIERAHADFQRIFIGLRAGLAYKVDGVLQEGHSADWGEAEAKTVKGVIDEANARVSDFISMTVGLPGGLWKVIPMVDYSVVYRLHSDGSPRRFDEAGTAWLDKWEHSFGIPDNGTVIGKAVVKGLQAAEDTDVFAMLAVRHLSIAMYTYWHMERWRLKHGKSHPKTWWNPRDWAGFWEEDAVKEFNAIRKRGVELFDSGGLLQYHKVSDMLEVMANAFNYGKL